MGQRLGRPEEWGGDANTNSVFFRLRQRGNADQTGDADYSAVLGPNATDADVQLAGSLSGFSNSNFGPVLRWTDGNNWYKAYTDGAHLIIQKRVAGRTTILASASFAATAGTSYTIEFQAVASTLPNASIWPTSSSPPSAWMLTATDASLASGCAGMRFLTQTGTATITSSTPPPSNGPASGERVRRETTDGSARRPAATGGRAGRGVGRGYWTVSWVYMPAA